MCCTTERWQATPGHHSLYLFVAPNAVATSGAANVSDGNERGWLTETRLQILTATLDTSGSKSGRARGALPGSWSSGLSTEHFRPPRRPAQVEPANAGEGRKRTGGQTPDGGGNAGAGNRPTRSRQLLFPRTMVDQRSTSKRHAPAVRFNQSAAIGVTTADTLERRTD